MKKILFTGEILVVVAMLLGCTIQKDIDQSLLKENLVFEKISYIEIEIDTYKQVITSKDNLDLLISLINDIQILDNELEKVKNIEEYNIIRIKIYDESRNIIESLGIGKEALYYNNNWYPVDIYTYYKANSFYENSGCQIIEDDNLLAAKQERSTRKEKKTDDALQGVWLSENGSKIKFDKDCLYQGTQYEYLFKYNIEKIYNYNIDISIYGIKGIFIEGRELSSLSIKMDETKSYMVVEKTMTGGIIYHDNYVHVDKEGFALGSFDSYFFYLNGLY